MIKIPQTESEQFDVEASLGLILKNAARALGGSAGVIATWNEEEHRFITSTSYGLSEKTLARLRPLLDEAAPDLAGSKESFNLLSQLRPDLLLPSSDNGMIQDPVIALPLQIGGKSIGLIYVLRPVNAASFSRVEQSILAAFAEQAAIAVQNAKLAHVLSGEKRRIESILESSADGIMSIDTQRRLVGFNTAMEKLTGYSREEVLGKECSKVLNFHNRDGKNLCQELCPMLTSSEEDKPTLEQQGVIRTKDGRDVDVSMVYSIARSPEGKPMNAVVNVRDISRLREVENLRETFLSMLGHELQTPLSIIKGYTSTLARDDSRWDRKTLRQGLQAIEEESDRLSKVMNKLLLASRINAGTLSLKREPLQLSSLVKKIVRRLRPMAKGHTFKIHFEPDFQSVAAEPQLMEEAIANLIENAIKYSREGGKVTISGELSDKQVRVTVADEGIGIPSGELEHIFERFYRVDMGPARKVQGLGLGLHICKTIIETHSGSIEVVSHLGKGSRFTISLPVGEDI